MNAPLNIVIGIATAGRREQIKLTLQQLARQTLAPTVVLVCPASEDDFDPACAASLPFPVSLVHGERGLTRQRNAIVHAAREADVVLFLDDDYYPASSYLQELCDALTLHPDVVLMTNHPIADGATGPGITHQQAVELLEQRPPGPTTASAVVIGPTYGGYGCNMAVRLAPMRQHDIRFDESLPLYGWLEDIDFSRRLAPYGRIVHNRRLVGVHLGTKKGRTSGLKVGYSQVANPLYMMRKGSLSPRYALRHVAGNVAMNIAKAFQPEAWVDRRGRLKGNLLAMKDLLIGRLSPERILKL